MKMKNKMTKTDRFNSEKIENEEKNAFSQFFHSCGIYIQKNYAFLILFFVGLFAVSAINFMKITTVQTVANFSISDFFLYNPSSVFSYSSCISSTVGIENTTLMFVIEIDNTFELSARMFLNHPKRYRWLKSCSNLCIRAYCL